MKKIYFFILYIGIAYASWAQDPWELNSKQSQPIMKKSEIDILHNDISQLNGETKKLGKAIEKQNKDVESLREEVQKLTKKTSDAKKYEDTISQLRKENSKLQQRLEEITIQKQKEIAVQEATIDSLKKVANQIHANGFINRQKTAPDFYCRAILESPLMVKYNQANVDYALEMAKLMGYDNKKSKFYDYYLNYVDLLKKYGDYYREFLSVVDKTVKEFNYPSSNNIEEMLKRYNTRISKMSYYKVRETGNFKEFKHIYYLDFQIEQIRGLFTPKQYKRENFEELQKMLLNP